MADHQQPSRSTPHATPALVRAGRGVWRAISWHRRLLAVLATVVAVATGLSAARPAAPPSRAVLVAAHALPGGVRLAADDLTRRTLPVAAVPDQAVTGLSALVGRTLVGPVTAGTVLTAADILGPDLPRSHPGDVIASVPLADATLVSQLAVGDQVDVLATGAAPGTPAGTTAQQARVVAAGARLVTVPAGSSGGPLGSTSHADSTVVLVEVDAATAARLAQAAATGELTIVLR